MLSKQGITKALIRLRGCAGWSAPLLFANRQRQVFSRLGPKYMFNLLMSVYIDLIWLKTYRGMFKDGSTIENLITCRTIFAFSCFCCFQLTFDHDLLGFLRPGLEVIKLESSLRLKIKRNDWLLTDKFYKREA